MDKKNYETNDQAVSHPSHYQGKNGLETIDVIEAFTDGLDGIEAVDTANVIKYICRWKQKNGIQDIEKAIWYATHLLNHLKSIDERDVAEGVDDSVIEANAKDIMNKIVAKARDGNNDEPNVCHFDVVASDMNEAVNKILAKHDEYIDILNKKDEEKINEKDAPVGKAYEVTDSKVGVVKIIDSLFYHGEQGLTLIFCFNDDAKNFVEYLKDYFDKTNENFYISAATILRMVSPDHNESASIDFLYSTIGWFDINDISYFDNIVEFSKPKSLFERVNAEIETRRNSL
jgi:hypothetical protein